MDPSFWRGGVFVGVPSTVVGLKHLYRHAFDKLLKTSVLSHLRECRQKFCEQDLVNGQPRIL